MTRKNWCAIASAEHVRRLSDEIGVPHSPPAAGELIGPGSLGVSAASSS
jgi:hypothetical protein